MAIVSLVPILSAALPVAGAAVKFGVLAVIIGVFGFFFAAPSAALQPCVADDREDDDPDDPAPEELTA